MSERKTSSPPGSETLGSGWCQRLRTGSRRGNGSALQSLEALVADGRPVNLKLIADNMRHTLAGSQDKKHDNYNPAKRQLVNQD